MKLKDGVFLHESGDDHMAVTQGRAAESFNGLIRNNKTAHDIYRLLMNETTEEQVVAAMYEKYDAPMSVISADVHNIIAEIRNAGLLDE